MKLFRNKFFVICLSIAVVLAAATSTFSIMGYPMLARNIVGVVTSPIRLGVTAVTNAIEGFSLYFGGIDKLAEENESLRQENATLKEQAEKTALLEAENRRLRAYLGMKIEYPSCLMEEAMIISRETGNYATVFTLNKGTLHGIEVNMPVIVESGIVGYVKAVGLNWCTVYTVIETATSVGAYIPRTGVTGLVEGDFSLKNEGQCKLHLVEGSQEIAVGDRVLSSGMGSVYPADVAIGEVVAIGMDEYNRTLVATVKPYVDFSSLEWVMIVTGYEEQAE